jgi:hypothetical protein
MDFFHNVLKKSPLIPQEIRQDDSGPAVISANQPTRNKQPATGPATRVRMPLPADTIDGIGTMNPTSPPKPDPRTPP